MSDPLVCILVQKRFSPIDETDVRQNESLGTVCVREIEN